MVDQGVRTKWGRTTFGGGRFPAMAIAVPCGMVLGALLGLLAASLGAGGSSPVLTGAVFALCLAFPSTLLVYVLVVDRDDGRRCREAGGVRGVRVVRQGGSRRPA
ncbi:hypothetical protein GM708_05755 [Vibrio cholerae]|nr:hypothetical protein [Vibrio cholerae]